MVLKSEKGRQEAERAARGFDLLANIGPLVDAQVVSENDLAGAELGPGIWLTYAGKHITVLGAVERNGITGHGGDRHRPLALGPIHRGK